MPVNMSTPPTSQEWDYTSSGIDNFLNRSIDQVSWQTTLDAMLNYPGTESLTTLPTPPNTNTLNMQSQAVTGSLGNSMAVGNNIAMNGSTGQITVGADGTDQIIIGTQQNGF